MSAKRNQASGGHVIPARDRQLRASFEVDLALCANALRRIRAHCAENHAAIGRDRLLEGLLQIDDLLTGAMCVALNGEDG
ncbi:MAG: hypothetical protein KatS3mg118_2177 [Paracoccaceae bacterium]|nr:MAG: hypothetical protein KatS3mg118_2177 [Paracoccaceae bacterium]